MLGVAAAQLGYRIHVFAPESGPACDIASAFTQADYHRTELLIAFAEACDVVTYEFENVPVAPLALIADRVVLRPGIGALEVAQSRIDEKRFARALGGRTAPFAMVDDLAALAPALEQVGLPAIVKTNRLGYDGKGQVRIEPGDDLSRAWDAIGGRPAIAEGLVRFEGEFSILLARGPDGDMRCYPPVANVHVGGILRTSVAPAPGLAQEHAQAARQLATDVADALQYVGVLALEFFDTPEGPVFNEMAPARPQQRPLDDRRRRNLAVREPCPRDLRPAAGQHALTAPRVEMENLVGDDAARWPELLGEPGAHLHLYGKHEIRPAARWGM